MTLPVLAAVEVGLLVFEAGILAGHFLTRRQWRRAHERAAIEEARRVLS